MKYFIAAVVITVVAVVAGIMAYRLSSDALAMVLGVMLGLVALLPTLFLTMLVARRNQGPAPEDIKPSPMTNQPPVIIVSGGYPSPMPVTNNMPNSASHPMLAPPPATQPREFRMMGYESTEAVELGTDEWSSFQ